MSSLSSSIIHSSIPPDVITPGLTVASPDGELAYITVWLTSINSASSDGSFRLKWKNLVSYSLCIITSWYMASSIMVISEDLLALVVLLIFLFLSFSSLEALFDIFPLSAIVSTIICMGAISDSGELIAARVSGKRLSMIIVALLKPVFLGMIAMLISWQFQFLQLHPYLKQHQSNI